MRTNWTVNSQQVFSNDGLLEQIGGKMASGFLTDSWGSPYAGKGLDDMIAGSFFYDLPGKRLYVWLPDGGDPNLHRMEVAVRESLISVDEGLSYIRISGLTLRHGNNHGMGTAVGIAGSHCVIEDVDQAWHAFSGAFVGGDYLTFNRCRFNHNGNTGMNGRRRGHRILNCETSYNNYRNWASEWHAGGVQFIPYCQDWVVPGHVAASNNGDGIWFDSSMSGAPSRAAARSGIEVMASTTKSVRAESSKTTSCMKMPCAAFISPIPPTRWWPTISVTATG